jgi:two-component system OmpR family response regulator
MRILLIEDDRVIATALREQAEGEGHSIDWAARLDEASDALATTGFDLILLI